MPKTKIAYFGVFTALALILSYVETFIPITFGIPGIKLGLPNLIIVVALYRLANLETLLISITRIMLAGLLFSGLFAILFGLSGGVISLFVMASLKRTDRFSVMGVSVAGGVSHNMAQLAIAMVVLETTYILYYLPLLLISGVVAGLLIGIVSNEIIKKIGAMHYTIAP